MRDIFAREAVETSLSYAASGAAPPRVFLRAAPGSGEAHAAASLQLAGAGARPGAGPPGWGSAGASAPDPNHAARAAGYAARAAGDDPNRVRAGEAGMGARRPQSRSHRSAG